MSIQFFLPTFNSREDATNYRRLLRDMGYLEDKIDFIISKTISSFPSKRSWANSKPYSRKLTHPSRYKSIPDPVDTESF